MRISPLVIVLFAAFTPVLAGAADDRAPDQQALDALEHRAVLAQPKEQCFLYAELVHETIEFSARQYAAGDVENATGLLKRAQEFTHRIHLALASNDKKLKDAQIILRRTAFRLSEMLHSSSFEDRPLVEQTLAQLNAAQTETMLQVFRK